MAIAYGRFAKDDGMVVDIRKYNYSPISVFDCRFWSDFTEENERLYVGSLHEFFVKTIHNVSTREDYSPFIRSISILQMMINGYGYQFGAVSSSDVKCLSALMKDTVDNDIFSSDYIRRFFNNFCNQIRTISLNMFWINCNDQYADHGYHGYSGLKQLFWRNDSIELIQFAKLFKNTIHTITVFDAPNRFDSSIELNAGFETELVKLMTFINSSSAMKNRFEALIIVKPKSDNLDQFINRKKDIFIKKYGWMLEKRPYHDIKRNSKCNDTVYFFPIV